MAIAFSQANTAENIGGSSTSHSFTGNGLASVSAVTDGIAVVWVESGGNRNPTGVTWGGAAMTMAVGSLAITGRGWSSLWYRLNPASGAVTLADTYAVNDAPVLVWEILSGVSQVTPEAINSGTAATNTITVSVTTLTDNAWLVGGCTNNAGTATAGAGTTLRFANVRSIGDSNGGKSPTGSYSLIFNRTGATGMSAAVMAVAPATASATNSNFLMFM